MPQTKMHPPLGLLLLYFATYTACSVFFQLRSEVPPWIDGSPIEYFTGGILWMSSLVSLMIAGVLINRSKRAWLWLFVSAGLALLALDELFAFHEKTSQFLGNDDHIKVFQWLLAGSALYLINRLERSPLKARSAFALGYVIHGLYILSDIGDGDYFRIPLISMSQLLWTEEYLELFALTAYCIGLVLLFTSIFGTTIRRSLQSSTVSLHPHEVTKQAHYGSAEHP